MTAEWAHNNAKLSLLKVERAYKKKKGVKPVLQSKCGLLRGMTGFFAMGMCSTLVVLCWSHAKCEYSHEYSQWTVHLQYNTACKSFTIY